jgi:hypothetical protein
MGLENSLILCWGWNCYLQKEELEVLPSLLGMNGHHMFPRFFFGFSVFAGAIIRGFEDKIARSQMVSA